MFDDAIDRAFAVEQCPQLFPGSQGRVQKTHGYGAVWVGLGEFLQGHPLHFLESRQVFADPGLRVAGIRQQPRDIGWKRIWIAPVPGPLEHAEASFESPYGRISSSWKVADGKFELQAEVPEGVTAILIGPDGSRKQAGPGRHTLTCDYRWSEEQTRR